MLVVGALNQLIIMIRRQWKNQEKQLI